MNVTISVAALCVALTLPVPGKSSKRNPTAMAPTLSLLLLAELRCSKAIRLQTHHRTCRCAQTLGILSQPEESFNVEFLRRP